MAVDLTLTFNDGELSSKKRYSNILMNDPPKTSFKMSKFTTARRRYSILSKMDNKSDGRWKLVLSLVSFEENL